MSTLFRFTACFLLLLLLRTATAQPGMGIGAYGPGAVVSSNVNERREVFDIRMEKSREVLKYMKLSVDPCSDFYDYACGNWPHYQRKQMREGEMRSAQNLVELEIARELQSILEEPTKAQDGANIRKVRDFYNSCVKVENPSSAQRNFLLNFMKMHGGLHIIPNSGWQPNYDWVQIIAQLRANYGLDILIGLDIDTNPQTMRGTSVYIGEPKTTIIPAEYCSKIATQEGNINTESYTDVQRVVADNMKSWLTMNEPDATRFAGDVVRFEYDLCKFMRPDHSMREEEQVATAPYVVGKNRLHGIREPPQVYPRIGLPQLTQKYDKVIDFQMFVDISLDTRINNPVYVRNEDYLQQLKRVVKKNSKATIAGYIMYLAMVELNLPRDDNVATRPQTCVTLVQRYFSKFIGEFYLRRVRRGETAADLTDIFNEIIKAFEQRLKAEWIDEDDQRAMRQRLSQFKLSFADYQYLDLGELHFERLDYWRKLELLLKYNAKQKLSRLQSGDFGQRGAAVDAYEVRMQLLPADHEISSGWGLLQTPFYHYYYPRALKYAILGQRIAHELIYAFDEQGWNENPLSPIRWRSNTLDGYRNSSECYRAQYSNYLFNNPETFRNASKLRELISDSIALSISFSAYLIWLEKVDPMDRILSKETLPDLNFTNTQLYFIYFAQTRCLAKYEEEITPEFLPLERHKPERFDVNGLLSNYEEFGREFGCALGSEMNTDDKCLIY